jgi:hypothetical protein
VTEKAKNGQMTINMDDRDRKDKINLTKWLLIFGLMI